MLEIDSKFKFIQNLNLSKIFLKIIKSKIFKDISYKNYNLRRYTPFHRIVSGYWCQGGDVTKFNGTGGTSIYGDSFDKERSNLRHTGPGILSTCDNDNDKTDSKFNLTFKCLRTLNENKTVFGRIIDGMNNIYKVI